VNTHMPWIDHTYQLVDGRHSLRRQRSAFLTLAPKSSRSPNGQFQSLGERIRGSISGAVMGNLSVVFYVRSGYR
jgi:hypothetical protein